MTDAELQHIVNEARRKTFELVVKGLRELEADAGMFSSKHYSKCIERVVLLQGMQAKAGAQALALAVGRQ